MAIINFGNAISLKQAALLITTAPKIRVHLEGPPGIGKSSILDTIREMCPNHMIAEPIDAQTLVLGDTGMPVVDRERMLTNYAPNSRFMISQAIAANKPVVIMIDEFTKASGQVRNMLHSLLEVKPRLGDLYLPEGSIIFTTGNLSGDGVGDAMLSHTRNRMTIVRIKPPEADELVEWGVKTGRLHAAMMAFIGAYPQVLASYTDPGETENPYIYNPKAAQRGYFTPRAAERASEILSNRDAYDDALLTHSLIGTLGEATARDLTAFIDYHDDLPKWADIVANPDTARVPVGTGACAVMVFSAITRIEKDSIDPFMTYLERLDKEWQATFAINVAKAPDKVDIVFNKSKKFHAWLLANEDLL